MSPQTETEPGLLSGTLRGTNQSGMRAQNERLVLTLLRRNGSLAKAEIARLTGLSAQTVSVIMRALEADGLIERGEPRRGRIGQPSVPMHLAPNGACFLGLKVGRRSVELVAIDFVGRVHGTRQKTHRFPAPEGVLRFVREAIPELVAELPEILRGRIAGLGIGLPFHLWDWADPLGVPLEDMAAWRDADLRAAIASELPFPVHVENDASAACNAEIVFGTRQGPGGLQDFLYAYIGFFAGGGLVLDGRLVRGRTGNAGALGSIPVPDGTGRSTQLLRIASLCRLEATLLERGVDASRMWDSPADWQIDEDILSDWIDRSARALAHATASAAALLDLEALVIDGWLPEAVRARLVVETRQALRRIDLSGSSVPEVLEGSIGPRARSLGSASLPLSERFLVDPGAEG